MVSSPEMRKKWWGNSQTAMDLRNGIHDGVEEIEMNLFMVTEFARTRRNDRKSSPTSSPET
jgi:hypothetical protein